jgi:hypothetical protein
MDRFRLNGFSRVGFLAVLANQIALVICVLSGSALTPVLGIIGAAIAIYWDWKQTTWIQSLTPGKTVITPEDARQMWISALIFGMPLLWLALPFSFRRLETDLSITEWVLNLVAMAAVACMCLAAYFKHVRI